MSLVWVDHWCIRQFKTYHDGDIVLFLLLKFCYVILVLISLIWFAFYSLLWYVFREFGSTRILYFEYVCFEIWCSRYHIFLRIVGGGLSFFFASLPGHKIRWLILFQYRFNKFGNSYQKVKSSVLRVLDAYIGYYCTNAFSLVVRDFYSSVTWTTRIWWNIHRSLAVDQK